MLPQYVNASGVPYAGAKATFYLTGTTTPSVGYQDSGLTTPHTNPVVADSKGLFAAIYLDQAITYKVVVTDANNGAIITIDPITYASGSVANVALGALSPAGNKVPYFTSTTAAALADFTSYGRSIVAVASEAGFKALTNLEIGTDVQAYNGYLADIAAITPSRGDVLYFNGTDWARLAAGTAGRKLQTNGAGADPTWSASGTWSFLELQEPTSDVSSITFSTVLSSYKCIKIQLIAQMITNGAYPILQCSPDNSTWRTVALGPIATQANGLVSWFLEVTNVDNADGTNLRVINCIHSAAKSANMDRSSNATNFNSTGIDAQAGSGGYTSYTEAFAYVRFTTSSGSIEGSTADQRAVATLWGLS